MLNQQIGPYKIISKLGEGGMANVYLAEKGALGKQVALKVLKEDFISNRHVRGRFLSEARKMINLDHPNIVGVHDLIDDNDFVAIELDYIEGKTLKQHLQVKGALPDDEIKVLFKQMLDAVSYVHEKGFVHRDIKPSNFMLTDNGIIKLTDFGIAKNVDDSNMDYTGTGTGIQMGTPKYMSPEQVRSTKDVDHRTDIYSLGVVLWEMVTGKVPYDIATESTFDVFTKIVNESLTKTNSKWDEVIQKATAKKENDRYDNIQEILLNSETKTPIKPRSEQNKLYYIIGGVVFFSMIFIAVFELFNNKEALNLEKDTFKNVDIDTILLEKESITEELNEIVDKPLAESIPEKKINYPFSSLVQKSRKVWKGIKDSLYIHKSLGTFYRLPVNYVSYGLHESNKAKIDMVLYDSIYGRPLGNLKRNESVEISNYEYHFYDFDKAIVHSCNNTVFDGCKTIIELSPGDTILLLNSAGESAWDVLHNGQLTYVTFSDEGWKLEAPFYDGCNMITGRRLTKDSNYILWMKARLSNGKVGYLKFDDMNESILKYFNVH